ncbi:hypothetical protein CK203_060015 [Vitis vinifera]|uniref:Uncharacterized protein n=1 Tax=Vitis vinifera TaxID=29760 RepID=A0A438GMS5_VITVI|nr:hypothetical protein CK203_060015 [Vitis vinifera]
MIQSKVRNSFQHANITVQGANSLNVSFAHHYSRCETPFWHTSAITLSIEMVSHRAKQGAKLSAKLDSRPFCIPILADASTNTVRHQRRHFTRCSAIHRSPSEGGTPSQCRYPTRRPPTDPVPLTTKAKRPASRPPAKRAKFSGPGKPSQPPQAKPPTKDSQIPMGIPLETIIRRPMIAGPPIEGNLDCRDRSFHSETWFDIDALKQQLELRDSFHLLRRYHMKHLLTLGSSIIP